jgi:hypothetical protein
VNRVHFYLSAGLIFVAGRTALADDTHYQDYPLGGRAVGFGGAFGAIADDPSGIFFNPAGLVDSNRLSVQISTTLYGLEISDTFFSAVERAANLDTVFTELNVIPSSGSFVSTLGTQGSDHRPQQAYGFGAFVPSYRSYSVQSVATIPIDELGCDQLAYQRKVLDRQYYFGGAFAHRLDEFLRFGVSAFLTYRSLSDLEETSCFSSSASENQPFATAQTNLDMGVASILLSLGMKLDLNASWTLGLNVTTPSIRVFDTANVRVTQGFANPDPSRPQTEFSVRELRGLEANTKVGTTLRFGVAYTVPRTLTWAADAVFQSPTKFTLFEIPPEEDRVRDAITLITRIERNFVINLSTGAEYLMSRRFSVAGGLFTNFSSAPGIPGEAGARFEDARLPHVHAFGGSFVLGFFSEHTLTRAGVTLSYGSGSDVVPRFEGLGAFGRETEYVKVDLSQLFLFFYISSTFRY